MYKNIKTQFSHYGIESPKDLVKLENIDHVIYSSRLTFLDKVNAEYKESNTLDKLFGLGRETIENINVIEIDIFDIFYSIGIFGTFIYLLILIVSINKVLPHPDGPNNNILDFFNLNLLLLFILCFNLFT